MTFGRWYPAATTLPDGRVVVHGGVVKLIKITQGSQVRRIEVYDPELGGAQGRRGRPAVRAGG
ncbi:hypothetical protein [Pseudonocardia sp.]|uniref:hypothetical protein n=1 Tax=Pseudonocardia sp. TaxID=60912 RepID=UPI00262774C6|nr:hypothetical protein [Pseudonocardia sp.]